MTNEEIIEQIDKGESWEYMNTAMVTHIGNLPAALNLARQDEREKITEEKVKDYFAGLSGKETALIVLNYLLRGGITDDDLRGLRLQWIKDDFCKCDSPDREAGYTYCHKCHKHVSDERFEQLTTEAT